MSGGGDTRPPRWAEALLDRSLPKGSLGRSARDDLLEGFSEKAARTPHRARQWFAWEAVKMAAHFGKERMRSGVERRSGGGGSGAFDGLTRNLRFAFRRLRRSPGFAFMATLTMALGIGANVAIFSVLNSVLLEPLPYENPERLVALFEWNQPRDRRKNVVNPGNFRAWREQAESFSAMSAVSLQLPAAVSVAGEPEEAMIQWSQGDFFDLLGLEAEVGRLFLSDPGEGQSDEVLLGHRYWQTRFGGDPAAVGRTIDVDGVALPVVGVLPPEYVVFGEGTDLWVATDLVRGDQTNSGRWLWAVGRLTDGVGFDAARSELQAIARGLQEEFPDFNAGWTIEPIPLKYHVVGDVSQGLWILMGAVALLLLVACANVANLFLVQATHRQKEMAVRTSLGASGGRLTSQLLTESLAVAFAGAVIGGGLAYVGTRGLARWIPDAFALPRVESAGVDGPVLLFAVVLTVVTGVLFGLVPAFQAARTSPALTLNAEGKGPSRKTGALNGALIVAEVMLSTVLLSGAALLSRSLTSLLAVDPGIDPDPVLVGRVNLNAPEYDDDQMKVSFFDEVLTRLSGRPGVVAAGGVTFLPMDGLGAGTSFFPMDRPPPPAEERPAADIRNVAGDYFSAMGIQLLEGREFDTRDGPDGPRTAVVNQTLAREYWPDESAVGKPVFISWETEEPWEIVGVVEDVRLATLAEEPRETIYLHYPRTPYFPWMQLAVRSTGEAATLARTVRQEVQALDPSLALGSVRVMQEVLDRSTARPRITAYLMAIFASLATVLAAVGLYGVLAYSVSQREREIGVRVALGASSRNVFGLVVRQGTILVGVGLVMGIAGALLGGRVVRSLLYSVEPTDPLALGAAGSLLVVVALLACLVPAWRAVKIPAAEALRAE